MSVFQCLLPPNPRPFMATLNALVMNKPQHVLLCVEPRRSLIVRAESDDVSVQGTATIPVDWFQRIDVHSSVQVSIELHTFLQALTYAYSVSEGSCIQIAYPHVPSGGITVRVANDECVFETVVLPRQMYSKPFDVHFDNNPIIDRFECDGVVIRDVVTSMEAFGSAQIEFTFDRNELTLTSQGSPWGVLVLKIDATAEATYRMECRGGGGSTTTPANSAPVTTCRYITSHVLSAVALSGGFSLLDSGANGGVGGPDRVCLRTNGRQLLSVVQQWRGQDSITNAVVEIVVVPVMQ
eukprot:PhF_6_TR37817/c0_g1_i1/m.56308